MKLAIVKPDHLGDLVLSSPAIKALAKLFPDVCLFVSSKTSVLAKYLFPDLELRLMDLPHLLKSGGITKIPDLTEFDLVLFLRRDGIITPEWAQLRTREFLMPEESHAHHQSILDYAVACEVVPSYDMDALFYAERLDFVRTKALNPPAKVGLSIGSGFYTNAWPLIRWMETAQRLQAQGIEISIVGGSAEIPVANYLARKLGICRANLIIGSNDFVELFQKLDQLDLVIASDGGTAHLCSLSVPTLSLFGSSPIKRYVPFGRWNRTISLGLSCSPCCQYARREVNGCLSVECMSEMDSEDVQAAMKHTLQPQSRSYSLDLGRGRTLYVGLSHLNQVQKIATRRLEAEAWSN